MGHKDFHKDRYEQWLKEADKTAKSFPESKQMYQTSSDIEVDALYFKHGESLDQKLSYPGLYPYTRGIHSTMYRGKKWTMRQYAGFGSARETNKRFRYLLDQGQTGLSVAFDLPTQIGYDSDDSMAEGEVGKVGVAIDSLYDMELLFDQIPLDQVSTSMTINAPAAILLAMYIAIGEKQGVSSALLTGTIQNDILKEYIARGTYIFPPKPSMRLITDIFQYCQKHLPQFNTISISGYHIREAGSTAVQEVAFTIANGLAYVDAALSAGLAIDHFAPRLAFFFNAHNHFFEEIAKFRAARRVWAFLMKEKYKAKNPQSWKLRFHTQTGGSTLTAQQPDNNIIRVTLQALAAVLGGSQSLHTNSKDEALSLPSEESAQIALRTQQIIAYESGVADTIDPLGGSYYVEYLTDEIENRVFEYLQEIEDMGGAVAAIESSYMQGEIQNQAYKAQKRIENKEDLIVGLNVFETEEKLKLDLLKVDEKLENTQRRTLKRVKENRSQSAVDQALENIRHTARTNHNIFPHILEAVKTYATVGEISHVLREEFGVYDG